MTAGFEENDSCFINWEKLTKTGNNALKDSERTNFLEHIGPVSYTHLDVYKRQAADCFNHLSSNEVAISY